MKCIICGSKSDFYFSKQYSAPWSRFLHKPVEYWKCRTCGFVISKTHCEMDRGRWQELNSEFHHALEDSELQINQPPYAEQAMMLKFLGENGIINTDNMLDYSGGYGTLSKILWKYHDIYCSIYDPFVTASSTEYIKEFDLRTFDVVINSAMFEHVLCRNDLNNVAALVSPTGAMFVHTVVVDKVPCDPNWFYLDPPVHTALHTNKSMRILMEQWGYNSSIYAPKAKSWLLLKGDASQYAREISNSSKELQTEWFILKDMFVDYWK